MVAEFGVSIHYSSNRCFGQFLKTARDRTNVVSCFKMPQKHICLGLGELRHEHLHADEQRSTIEESEEGVIERKGSPVFAGRHSRFTIWVRWRPAAHKEVSSEEDGEGEERRERVGWIHDCDVAGLGLIFRQSLMELRNVSTWWLIPKGDLLCVYLTFGETIVVE